MVDLPGMYRKDGHIYKVQESRQSGRLYAKELIVTPVEGGEPVTEFAYAKGVVYRLSASDMMTLAEAKEFGALYGVCCVCGRLLTNETSIEAGIGPICAQGEQFANPNATKMYQTDEEREAAIEREEARDAARVAPAPAAPALQPRRVEMAVNKYGPVFKLSWGYQDSKFAALKDEVKGWDWNATKRAWNSDLKAWTVAVNDDSAAIVMGFALRNEFVISPEAEAKLNVKVPEVAPEREKMVYDQWHDQEPVKTTADAPALPLTFNDLLGKVSA